MFLMLPPDGHISILCEWDEANAIAITADYGQPEGRGASARSASRADGGHSTALRSAGGQFDLDRVVSGWPAEPGWCAMSIRPELVPSVSVKDNETLSVSIRPVGTGRRDLHARGRTMTITPPLRMPIEVTTGTESRGSTSAMMSFASTRAPPRSLS